MALEINEGSYEIVSVDIENSVLGEGIHVLDLDGDDGDMRLSWGAGQDVEEVAFVPVDGDTINGCAHCGIGLSRVTYSEKRIQE